MLSFEPSLLSRGPPLLGFMAQGFGFRFWGFRVLGFRGFRVLGFRALGFRVWSSSRDLRFRASLGLRVYG